VAREATNQVWKEFTDVSKTASYVTEGNRVLFLVWMRGDVSIVVDHIECTIMSCMAFIPVLPHLTMPSIDVNLRGVEVEAVPQCLMDLLNELAEFLHALIRSLTRAKRSRLQVTEESIKALTVSLNTCHGRRLL
jgi:hypothetical protein